MCEQALHTTPSARIRARLMTVDDHLATADTFTAAAKAGVLQAENW